MLGCPHQGGVHPGRVLVVSDRLLGVQTDGSRPASLQALRAGSSSLIGEPPEWMYEIEKVMLGVPSRTPSGVPETP